MPRPEPMRVTAPTRRTLAGDTYEAIKALIMDGRIGPDEQLAIDRLAADLVVSQTPVREALARLEADGLVTKEAHKSYRVAPRLTAAGLAELYEFRLMVEPTTAARAAERRTPSSLRDLERIGRELKQASTITGPGVRYEDYARFVRADSAFHDAIAIAAGNMTVAEILIRLRPALHLSRYMFPLDHDTVREHASVLNAIRAQAPRDAEKAMTAHLEAAFGRLSVREPD